MTDLTAVDVLLVEDNAEDAEMTQRALRGHALAEALHHVRDGVEALDFLFARGEYARRQGAGLPKLVLLDLKLPRVDGLEVLRQVKTDARLRAIPVVVMTSSREDRDLVQSYELGVNSFVVKPVKFEDFTAAVSQLGLYWLLVNQPRPR